jgi:hypothetical protein
MSEYFRAADIKAAHRSTTPATLNMINTLFGKNELRGLHKREYAATSESIPIKQPHISAADFAKIVQRGLGTNFPNKRKVAPSHLACQV